MANPTIEESSRAGVHEAVDLSNSIRANIRGVIRRHHADGLLLAGETIVINAATLPVIKDFLALAPQSEQDTTERRLSFLRTQSETQVFTNGNGPYIGAAMPDRGIPFTYRLRYLDALAESDIFRVEITALTT